ncbi:glycoside hydrolase superfamily [Chytriomyces sp. MP71]|nr:glycoside hydrolase superfamily [Chytriomyces sp. MP71]
MSPPTARSCLERGLTLRTPRMRRSEFHLSQAIPLAISPFDGSELTAPLSLIEKTGTDAILFLTLYPNQDNDNSWDLIKDSDLEKLAWQLGNITAPELSNRRVMLRYAPEFNGNWFHYSQQPQRFVTEWKRLVDKVRSVTKRVAFVWSPNAGNNYPFGGNYLPKVDLATLDTNKDGKFDINDDPYTPYYPGDDYVDWVGMSVYWKGDPALGYPTKDNSKAPGDYWSAMVEGSPSTLSNPKFPFYDMFAQGHNKPLVMSEGGGAFAVSQGPTPETPLPANAGQLAIQQSFWQTYLNASHITAYPKAKMFMNFEFYRKQEDPTGGNNGVTRDYRITWEPTVVAALKADLNALGSSLVWANAVTPGGGSSGPAPTGSSGGVAPVNSATTTSKSGAAPFVSTAATLVGALAVAFMV